MKIYVIIGSTGEYSDRSEWPVCWRATREEAEAVIATCNEQAAAFKKWRDESMPDDREEQARLKTMLDPLFQCDYTGTRYGVWTVCEDPNEDREERKMVVGPSIEVPFEDEGEHETMYDQARTRCPECGDKITGDNRHDACGWAMQARS